VNITSSNIGGSGKMIIASIINRNAGVANLWRRASAISVFKKFTA
jgi:ABC-type spermidine/putrescine transport system permease subunit I